MVIYVYPTPENKYYEFPNPRPIQHKKIHFVSPNSPQKILTLFSVGYIFIFTRQLKTEDCSCTEYNQHTLFNGKNSKRCNTIKPQGAPLSSNDVDTNK